MWTIAAIAAPLFLAVGIIIGIRWCTRGHPQQWSTTSTISSGPTTTVEGEFHVSKDQPHKVNTRGMTRSRRVRIVQGNRRGQPFERDE